MISSTSRNNNSHLLYPISPVLETFYGDADSFYDELERPFPFRRRKTSPPSMLQKSSQYVFLGQDNLDTISMNVTDSEVESSSSVSSCESLDSKPSELKIVRKSYPGELDEIELRSRALRSLLLKKHACKDKSDVMIPTNRPDETVKSTFPSVPVVAHSSSNIGTVQAEMRLGLKNGIRKFIIPLDASSDSDSDPILLTKHEEPMRKQVLPNSPPEVPTSSGAQSKTHVTSSSMQFIEVQSLRCKMDLFRMKLTVKRQQRIVDEQRRSTHALFRTVSSLRKQWKIALAQYKRSAKLLLAAGQLLSSQQKELTSLQKRYAITPSPSSLVTTSTTNKSHTFSEQAHRKKLFSDSLGILELARTRTAYFSYFSFEVPVTQYPVAVQENLHEDANTNALCKAPSRINPNIPICPFSLDGNCKDKSCTFQHPFTLCIPQAPEKIASSPVSRGPLVSTVTDISDIFQCPFCPVLLSSRTQPVPDSLQKWHLLYSRFQRCYPTCSKKSIEKFISMSAKLQKEYAECSALTQHHISSVCTFYPKTTVEQIAVLLKDTNHPIECCRLVLRHTHLPVAVRKTIAEKRVDDLTSVGDESMVEDPASSSDLIFSCYHYIRLLKESASDLEVHEFLKKIMASVSSNFYSTCGLWWIKLSLALTDRLPSEDSFFSTANIPSFSNLSAESNSLIIQEAAAALSIPESTIDTLESFPNNHHTTVSFNSYLAVVHLYVQMLLAKKQYRSAFDLCIGIATSHSLEPLDDLFFPTAIFALSNTNFEQALIESFPESIRCRLSTSFRIEVAFLHGLLLWRKSLIESCSSVLVECLASLVLLHSDEFTDVTKTYEDLLLSDEASCSGVRCPRGLAYLWLSYGLYSLLHATDLTYPLERLLGYYRSLLIDHPNDEPPVWHHRLLHMILTIINRLYSNDSPSYKDYLISVFVDQPLFVHSSRLPTWFIELLQRINLTYLPSPGPRHDVTVALVQAYGWQLISGFCRSLVALNDQFLAKSLCAIGVLDKPDNADFWLLYAALIVSTTDGSKSRDQSFGLIELFADAVSAVPSSRMLWEHYTKAVLASGANTDALLKSAKSLHMLDIVMNVIEEMKPDVTEPEHSTIQNLKRKTTRTIPTPSRSKRKNYVKINKK